MEAQAQSHSESDTYHVISGIWAISFLEIISLRCILVNEEFNEVWAMNHQ